MASNETEEGTLIPKPSRESLDSKAGSRKNRMTRSNSSLEEEEDALYRASSDNTFNISQLATRQKAVIPPPSERDIVRKHIDTSSQARAQSPLGSLLNKGPLPGPRPDSRTRTTIKVNSTGLPRPPTSGAPGIGKLQRYEHISLYRSLII